MKSFRNSLLVAFLSFSAISSFASNDYGMNQQIERVNGALKTKYNCPVIFSVDLNSMSMKNNQDRESALEIIGETEYPIRMACKNGSLKGKITEIKIKCGSEAFSGRCSPAQNGDGSTAKLDGKIVQITGKYANCACGKNAARAAVEGMLK
ncbi:MAG: hypothetical protein KGP28_07070 [Bdellovibrionales bacterium]|nr:hypothetical protein [Bdellovibrionales bacterium]